MNPWGLVLIFIGVILVMIGVTGTQHKILTIAKGVPASARGVPASQRISNPKTPGNSIGQVQTPAGPVTNT